MTTSRQVCAKGTFRNCCGLVLGIAVSPADLQAEKSIGSETQRYRWEDNLRREQR